MKITSYGHCCLLLEVAGKRILTDPGSLSTGHETLCDLDIILITHEHADHCHSEAVATLVKANPACRVVTNVSVEKLLVEMGIACVVLSDRERTVEHGVALTAYTGRHVEIYQDFGQVENTGYLINDEFFYPGDAYTVPEVVVRVLALPVAGPWCKVSEALDYCYTVAPRIAIPVHDAVLSTAGKGVVHGFFERMLTARDIEFVRLEQGEGKEV